MDQAAIGSWQIVAFDTVLLSVRSSGCLVEIHQQVTVTEKKMAIKPKDNPHIYGTRAAERQKFHDQWQAKRDAQYDYKPPPARRESQSQSAPVIFTPQSRSDPEPRQRSRSSPRSAIMAVGLIVGFVAVAYAASHGVTSTLGMACAFGFPAGIVVAILKKLTKS